MKVVLSNFYTASALGNGNAETLANYCARVAPGMRLAEGEVPGRAVWFGHVTADLPAVDEARYDTRTNRLLALAVREEPAFAAAVARYGVERVGIVLGSSNTGVHEAMAALAPRFAEDCGFPYRPRPADATVPQSFDHSMLALGTPSLFLKRLLGVRGPAYTVSTACSSSAKAFGAARRLIAAGVCDAVITGGVDGRCRFALNGFAALGALSAGRCRPLAPDRDGINLGEGVALFVMECGDSPADGRAVAPRPPHPVVFAGLGETSDAYHATAPDPEGRGAEAAMRAALADAASCRVTPATLDYVNLHGTGTVANDAMEMKAVRRIWPNPVLSAPRGQPTPQPFCESTKDLTGHCLGAAGAVEAAICALLIRSGRVHAALSNSFAFGGSNASLVLAAG